jgi:hypothetical protein
VYTVINGIPVAVLVLDDAEEWPRVVQESDAAAAAAETLAEGWAPPRPRQQQRSRQQSLGDSVAQLATTSNTQQGTISGRAAAASSSGGCELWLAAMSKQRLGDVMWRAKALASRGYWCEVVSSRDWALLEGHLDAQVDYLRDRLWPLLPQQERQEEEFLTGASSQTSAAQAQAV